MDKLSLLDTHLFQHKSGKVYLQKFSPANTGGSLLQQ